MIDLDNIKARAQALQQHAGTTDYASQVISDNVELVAEVEKLRAAAHRDHSEIVRWLRREASAMHPAEPDRAMLSYWERNLLLVFAACIERGEHLREVK